MILAVIIWFYDAEIDDDFNNEDKYFDDDNDIELWQWRQWMVLFHDINAEMQRTVVLTYTQTQLGFDILF